MDINLGLGITRDGDRPKGDFYPTSEIAVLKLLDFYPLPSSSIILEPCCGNGAISKILVERGHNVISKDLYDWGYGKIGEDFLTSPIEKVDVVLTNPPFNLSYEFVIKSLECTKEKDGKVILLNRIQWLEGIKRKKLFESTPISKVLIFSKRLPFMHRFGYAGKKSSSTICYAWFIWNWKHCGEPTIGWL